MSDESKDPEQVARRWINSQEGIHRISLALDAIRDVPTPACAVMVLHSAIANILMVVRDTNDKQVYDAFCKVTFDLFLEALDRAGFDFAMVVDPPPTTLQ